jgi:hypothetical protein
MLSEVPKTMDGRFESSLVEWEAFRNPPKSGKLIAKVKDKLTQTVRVLQDKIPVMDVVIGYPTQAVCMSLRFLLTVKAFPPSAAIWGALRILLTAAKEQERAYDMIENCFEKTSGFLTRLNMSVSACEVSSELRNIYLLILVDILKIFGIATSYVKKGGFSMLLILYLLT